MWFGRARNEQRRRCQIADGLVVTMVVVVIDEDDSLGLEIAGQIMDFSRMRFFSVCNCQRSILPWVWGWKGAPGCA